MDPEISGKLRNSLKYFGGAGLKCSYPPPTHPTAFFFFPLGPPVCINGIPDTLWAWGLKEEYCRRDCQPQQGGSLQDHMADTLWGGLLTPNEKGGVLPVSLKATRAVWTGSWANTTGHSDPSAVGADTALGATSQCLTKIQVVEGNGSPLQYPCLENLMEETGRLQSMGSQRVKHD